MKNITSRNFLSSFLLIISFFLVDELLSNGGYDLSKINYTERPYTVQDTFPLEERYGDYINDNSYNPFDITPSSVTQEVEYDPNTDRYIIIEKIGDEYYRAPSYMTFDEYVEWRANQQETQYFNRLAGINSGIKSGSGKVDPMSKIDIKKNLIDRLFGGSEVTIQPQGNIDITTGLDYQNVQNPSVQLSQQKQGPFFDFDMDIRMNVEGSIGKKLNLGFNYDTQATFDFDRKIKLEYDTEAFSEDDIIKSIEAGNVNLPLNSQLIQGSQSLFGLKTDLQFGKLRLSLLASQQRAEQNDLTIENGSLVQEYEIRPEEYDENRHFFLTHYHRKKYEAALAELPYIDSQIKITNIQVWITNDTDRDVERSTFVCALADIAKGDIENYENPMSQFMPTPPNSQSRDTDGVLLPDNDNNGLYGKLVNDDMTRVSSMTASSLTSSDYGLTQVRDFATFRGRLLTTNEYSFNPELGFISLNVRLRQDQVLAVAFEYNYSINGDKVYQVGELTNDAITDSESDTGEPEPESVIYLKMLKSSNQRTSLPSWDLMMKNVYPLGTAQLSAEDFKFDIFFEDNTDGSLVRFIPENAVRVSPLLNLFGLDRLNGRLDPQEDGIFDFVEGVTIIPSNGSIIFPKLEPFGSFLVDTLMDKGVPDSTAMAYGFTELYDSTVVKARESLEKNRFVMRGQFKSSISSEISLGSFNIPQGSVTVRAGSDILQEGVDYEIDYGLGRLTIINPSYLQAGTPIRVSFEDQSLFSLQQKTMLGVRADYQFNDKFNVGATYLRLFERPFTQKVNIGSDPINNRIYGLDFTYSSESEFVTKLVDKLPFYSTKEISNVNFSGEVAALRPGHSKAINLDGDEDTGGVVSIDNFEGSGSSIPLGNQPNRWVLASCPQDFGNPGGRPEGGINDNLIYGANRAKLNWYTIDPIARSSADNEDSYTRLINQDELFDREVALDQLPDLFTFDLTYYPTERGPYNFDIPGGRTDTSGAVLSPGVDVVNGEVRLREPEKRWAGIMRNIDNNDFQAANVEYIEFWMLNPFIDQRGETNSHEDGEEGKLYFHLGSVSEDILRDNLQMYENSVPLDASNPVPFESSAWSEVPLTVPTIIGFPNNPTDIEKQDVGFDGVSSLEETTKFNDYIQSFSGGSIPVRVQQDPANDDFLYFDDPSLDGETNLLRRYRDFNGPEGNSPDGTSNERGNPRPDIEDLNNNRSLDQGESYYEYEITLRANMEGGELDTLAASNYLRESRPITNPNTGEKELWYRFQIPVKQGTPVNGIEGFRSIQFMRMIMTGFETQKTLRLAEFELVRNQWRTQESLCNVPGQDGGTKVNGGNFAIDVVGIQENNAKKPFNYILPRGIKQQQLFSTFNNVLQDERSLVMTFNEFESDCEGTIFKWSNVDLRVFERLQMFVHAEEDPAFNNLDDGEMSIFMRIGRDFVNNYYEYEIPLSLSRDINDQSQENIWKESNRFDFPLELLTNLKQARNLNGTLVADEYVEIDPEKPENSVKIKGNPSLGYIKGIQIGIRTAPSADNETYNGEVWINELRATGLNESGGVAGIARMDIQMADLGTVSAAGGFSTIGFGGLDQRLDERQKEAKTNYDVATNLNLDKFFPIGWNLSIPFFAQYSKSISKPQFDPFDLDISVEESVNSRAANDPELAAEIRDRANDVTTITTFNFTNVKKNRGTGGARAPEKFDPNKPAKPNKPKTPKPWDIENFAVSYAYTKTDNRDPILKLDRTTDVRGGLDYNYSTKAKYIKPLKFIKGSWLKFLTDFNFNPIPNTITFNTQLRRIKNQRIYRLPREVVFAFDDIRFDWNRQYSLRWDLAKSLKLNFNATNTSIVDELRQVGIPDTSPNPTDPNSRTWVNEFGEDVDPLTNQAFSDIVNDNPDYVKDYRMDNIRQGGRNKAYQHSVDVAYTLPFSLIKPLSWITAKAQYKGGYSWSVAPLSLADVGNTIQNSQNRSFNSTFNFEKLYDKSNYLKKIQGKKTRSKRSRNRKKSLDQKDEVAKGDSLKKERKKEKRERSISLAEKILIRPLLSIRSLKFNLRQDFNTVVPGFSPTNKYLGLSSGFDAPGVDFVAGWQPDISYTPSTRDNWLYNAAGKGWISTSERLNTQVSQSQSINWDARLEIEPIKNFNIDIDFKKTYRSDHTENFRFLTLDPDPTDPNIQGNSFNQIARYNVGSFEVTYFAMNTLFGNNVFDLVNTFKNNRVIVSNRLENKAGAGTFEGNPDYAEGFGPWANEVAIPAFLAAYTGQDLNLVNDKEINTDLQTKIQSNSYIPAPNWNLNYRGLSKVSYFKDIFTSFDLTHGYKSTLRVARFFSDQEYQLDPFNQDARLYSINQASSNYFSRIEIPQLTIDEQFSPLLGLRMKTKNNINLDIEYRKGRRLELITQAKTINESRNTEISLGLGYTIPNINIGFLTGDKKGRKTRKKRGAEEDEADPANQRSTRGSVNRTRGRELTINVDFALRDDVTYRHNVNEQGNTEPYRGTKSIRLSPSVNYDVDKNLTIRTFVDYSKQIPYITTSFPVTSIQGGITVRFNLN